MAGLECNCPHTVYAGLHNSLHQEWYFVQRVTLDIGAVFQPVEDALREAFLPDLFKVATYQIPGRVITSMPVKQDSIDIPDLNQNAGSNWTTLCVITIHLVTALHGTAEFWSGDHAILMGGAGMRSAGVTLKMWRRNWGKTRPQLPWRTPAGWDGSRRNWLGCQCCHSTTLFRSVSQPRDWHEADLQIGRASCRTPRG